jgi:hypothetical protein
LGAGQSGHPNLNGGPVGESQTLGHPLKAAKSGLLMGICRLTWNRSSKQEKRTIKPLKIEVNSLSVPRIVNLNF